MNKSTEKIINIKDFAHFKKLLVRDKEILTPVKNPKHLLKNKFIILYNE